MRDFVATIDKPHVTKHMPSTNGRKTSGTGVTFVGAPDWRQIISLDSYADPDAEELTRNIALATSVYAYTAIMYRATRVAEPRLFVAEDTDDGEAEVEQHELSMLLDEPSEDFDMGELQQLTEIYRLITGSCLWVKQVDIAERTAQWMPFSGDEFTTYAKDGRIYGLFRIDLETGPVYKLPEEVVHFRDLNPQSWRRGLSKLDVALASLDLGHQVSRTIRNFMRKAMFPGGIISPDAKWNPTDEEWEAWKAAILGWHQGPANAGDPLVVQGGTQFSKAALGLKELLPSEILDRIETSLGSVFGIPPVVLGWKVGLENSPWSQMGEARQMTYEDTIEPRWRDIEKKMTRQLLPREEREAGRIIRFDTEGIRAFQQDDQTKAKTAGTLRREWTLNERRVYTGKDPLPEDDPRGNEIDGPGSAVPIEDDEKPDDEKPDDEKPDDEKPDDEKPDDDEKMLSKALSDNRVLEWTVFDASSKAAESTWERSIARLLRVMQKQILDMADHHLEDKAIDPDSIIEFVEAVGEFIREKAGPLIESTLLPLVVSTGRQGLRRASAQTGISFSLLEPGLLDYAAEEARFLSQVMGKTTGKFVAETVQAQLAQGGVIADVRKALETNKAFTRQRAQMVARTETTRAWNGAQRRGLSDWAKANDSRVTKEWLSSRDDRVRPEHEDMDGEKVFVDESFSNGLDEPSEPNCRCTLVYSVVS